MARDPDEPRSSEITPEAAYHSRRLFMRNAGLATAGAAAFGGGLWALSSRGVDGTPAPEPRAMPSVALATAPADIEAESRSLKGELTPLASVTTYNNFYELGLGKGDPARNGGALRPSPWSVRVEGECARPTTFGLEDLLAQLPQEERIYRFRCVEAWSMVIPWLGFPLARLLAKVEPTSRAKWVAFTTLFDPQQLPGQASDALDWPYVEGLRIDEAQHPLTILATGLYGKLLPNQNGAPLRLVVPWKYGFKSIKSIVKITLTEHAPPTTWSAAAPSEYGFFANVNPTVDHPRWSQATERRVGELERRKTLMFNGYADQVAALYASMDLTRSF